VIYDGEMVVGGGWICRRAASHPERSEAESKDPVALIFGSASGFLDFARNDELCCQKFLRAIDGNLWNSRLSHLMSATTNLDGDDCHGRKPSTA